MSQQSNTLKKSLLAGATVLMLGGASFGLVGCGDKGKDGKETKSSRSTSAKMEIGANLSGGKSPIDQPFTYKEGKAVEVETFFAAMAEDGDGPVTYDSTSFDSKTGATVILGLKSTDGSDKMSIGRLELYGVNQESIDTLKADTATPGKLDVVRKMRAFDINIDGDGEGDITIGALEIDDLKIKGNDEAAMDALPEGQSFAAAMDSFSVSGIYLKDLVLVGSSEEGPGISMKAADMRFGAMGSGVFGGLYIKGVDFSMSQSDEMRNLLIGSMGSEAKQIFSGPLGNLVFPKNQAGTIGEMTWGGVDITGWMEYLRKGEKAPVTAKNLIKVGGFEVKDVVSTINGKKAATSKLSKMEPIEFEWFMPTKIRSSDKTATLNLGAYMPEEMPQLAQLVEDKKLTNIPMSSEVTWDYDTKAGKAKFFEDVKMKGFANFLLEFNVSDAKLEPIVTAMQLDDESVIENIALNDFTLRIQDEAFLDFLFEVGGQQQGMSGADARSTVVGLMPLAKVQANQVSPKFGVYIDAMQAFLSEGGTLEIKLAPKQKLSLATLADLERADPSTIPDVLGLSVTHQK